MHGTQVSTRGRTPGQDRPHRARTASCVCPPVRAWPGLRAEAPPSRSHCASRTKPRLQCSVTGSQERSRTWPEKSSAGDIGLAPKGQHARGRASFQSNVPSDGKRSRLRWWWARAWLPSFAPHGWLLPQGVGAGAFLGSHGPPVERAGRAHEECQPRREGAQRRHVLAPST